jgi:Outer membrane protein beta-barrel domain
VRFTQRLCLLLPVATSTLCPAQSWLLPRGNVGVQLSSLRMDRGSQTTTDLGIGGSLDYKFSPRISLSSEVTFFPKDRAQTSSQDGGSTLIFQSGPRLRIINEHRFALYGQMRPGLISFGNVPLFNGTSTFKSGRVSHFAMNFGGGIEYRASERVALNLDLGSTLMEIHSRTTHIAPGLDITSPGQIRGSLQTSLGISYGFGEIERAKQVTEAESRRFEVGIQLATLGSERSPNFDVTNEIGVGGLFSYNINKYFSADGALTMFPKEYHHVDFQQGGSITQGLFGLKTGIRGERVGVFLKMRPGFQRYSQTIQDFTLPLGQRPVNSLTHFAFDLGGVIEVKISTRTLMRFEAGDVMRFQKETRLSGASVPTVVPSHRFDTIQLSTGILWRF